jgi:hypothetical protein
VPPWLLLGRGSCSVCLVTVHSLSCLVVAFRHLALRLVDSFGGSLPGWYSSHRLFLFHHSCTVRSLRLVRFSAVGLRTLVACSPLPDARCSLLVSPEVQIRSGVAGSLFKLLLVQLLRIRFLGRGEHLGRLGCLQVLWALQKKSTFGPTGGRCPWI